VARQAEFRDAFAAATANLAAAETQLAEAQGKRLAVQEKLDALDDAELARAAYAKAGQLRNAKPAKRSESDSTDFTGERASADEMLASGYGWDVAGTESEYAKRNAAGIASLQGKVDTFGMSEAEQRRASFLRGMPSEDELRVFDDLNSKFEDLRRQEQATQELTATLAATFSDVLIQPLLHGLDGVQSAFDAILGTIERILASIAENAILLALGGTTGGIGGAILTKLGFAEGGYVSGRGGPKDDAVPAWLSNGEFVQPAEAVAHYGRSFMDAIRNRALPRFASGGLVGGMQIAGAGAGGGNVFHIQAIDPKTTAEFVQDRLNPAASRTIANRQAGLYTGQVQRAIRPARDR
jgi:hypothetical protein